MKYNLKLIDLRFSVNVRRNNGERRVDFFVDEKICVELKVLTALENVHFEQARNYLEAFNVEVGLLINFGGKV